MSDAAEPLVVPASLAGERLDRAVALLTGWSRNEVQALVRDGAVLVAGETAARSRRLAVGEVIELLSGPATPSLPGPEPMSLDVRYRDDEILVIAKPAGLVVHPGAGHPSGTLVNGLLALDPAIATVGDPTRPGIVHRLDRDTSGLLVVARTAAAHRALVAALAAREVERRYLALVRGIPEAARGIVDAPIGRSSRRRTQMAVRAGGRPARTGYEVQRGWPDPGVALLECTLESGRTHQIRVHLGAIGHPIVGDAAYGGDAGAPTLPRPFLHAHRLALAHPITGEALAFEDPLPAELATVLTELA